MKKLYFLLFTLTLVLFTSTLVSSILLSCSSNDNNRQGSQVVVNQSQPNIGENLNLQAVGEIIRHSSNPQEIEKKLNEPDGVNNLDLDGDGKIDYLKVTEYGKGSEHGYSICAVLKDGEPEVANVVINTLPNQQAQMSLNGNPTYYGNQNNTYQSSFNATDFLLLAWLMQPHYSYYHSPYHYGYYGYGYGLRPIVSYHSYYARPYIRSVPRTYTVSRPVTSSIASPNAHNTSSVATHRASLSNPTQSQKSFKVNDNTSTRSVSGFGNKSNSSGFGSSSSSSYKSSSPSRSSSSSFGSSSRSSGGGGGRRR